MVEQAMAAPSCDSSHPERVSGGARNKLARSVPTERSNGGHAWEDLSQDQLELRASLFMINLDGQGSLPA